MSLELIEHSRQKRFEHQCPGRVFAEQERHAPKAAGTSGSRRRIRPIPERTSHLHDAPASLGIVTLTLAPDDAAHSLP
ncbi:MAG TPA: hypothetical protein PLQ54_03705 [Armatimonadota bacterium]|nr:hypothetical protein [Armatimonadota bacterium]